MNLTRAPWQALPAMAVQVSLRMGVAPGFWVEAERVGEESLGMHCHRDGAGVPVISRCGLKRIVGLDRLGRQPAVFDGAIDFGVLSRGCQPPTAAARFRNGS